MVQFIVDFLLLIVPPLVSFTFTEYTAHIMTLQVAASIPMLLPRGFLNKEAVKALQSPRKNFVTSYRSFMMISTCVAILAVDFTIFPRRFAKTEDYGVSLMDVGVGCFVLSGGLVSPQARGSKSGMSSYAKRLWGSIRSSLPLFIIGGIRLALIKGVEYQEHVSEYGVHWNFFLTLACVSVFSSLLSISPRAATLLGVLLTASHQVFLSTWARDYIMHAPRTDFFSMNREGILSLPGYWALFLIGVSIGSSLVQPRGGGLQNWGTFTLWFAALSVAFVGATYGAQFAVEEVSRRMVNASYILWVAGYNTTIMFLMFLVDAICPPLKPSLLDAVNFNQLFVFLLGNILTGLINVNMYTLFASPSVAFSVMVSYLFVLCATAATLHTRNVAVKFW